MGESIIHKNKSTLFKDNDSATKKEIYSLFGCLNFGTTEFLLGGASHVMPARYETCVNRLSLNLYNLVFELSINFF